MCFYLPSLCPSPEKAPSLGFGLGYLVLKLLMSTLPPLISDVALTCTAGKMGGAASARSVVIVNV